MKWLKAHRQRVKQWFEDNKGEPPKPFDRPGQKPYSGPMV
jgi:hypothetical protein